MCGGGEADLGLVMLAYTVLFLFPAKIQNCCDLMLFLLAWIYACVCICLQVFLSQTIPITM